MDHREGPTDFGAAARHRARDSVERLHGSSGELSDQHGAPVKNEMKKTRRTVDGRGFTLLELMIATAVFLVISGAGLALFSRQQPLFNRQQNLAGLNIAVRNAVAQLQLDVVNAGNGTMIGTAMPNVPVGISITNSIPSTACNTP